MVALETLFARGKQDTVLRGHEYVMKYLSPQDPMTSILNAVIGDDQPDAVDLQHAFDIFFTPWFITAETRQGALMLHGHAVKAVPIDRYGMYAATMYWGGKSWERQTWYPDVLNDVYGAIRNNSQDGPVMFVDELLDRRVPVEYDNQAGRLRVTKYLMGDESNIPAIYSNHTKIE